MCGITGAVWHPGGRPLDPQVLDKMTDVLRHRGPDDRGSYVNEVRLSSTSDEKVGVALGHRRLAIIDEAGGHQPMSNEDGTIWVVFNGEIYNHPQLRHRLEGSGHTFRTNSDTESLVHLYEDEGVDFLSHLNGMFSLAIWDQRRRRLLLARDRLGQKPLVYRQEPGRLLFASELKSLLQVPDVPREIDPGSLDAYLTYQYVPHPRTIFRGIHKLPPAHYALYSEDGLKIGRYWTPDFNREEQRPEAEYVEQLRETLTSSVKLRLQSDVPLGAFLSGGLDSSIIVALMSRLTDQKVRTFSIGFSVPEYDETRYAQDVAKHVGTAHEVLRVEPDAVDVLSKLVWHYDEPFSDSSAIPTYYLSKLTRQHVTVALSGDGGDELFAGYPRYRAVRLSAALDAAPRSVRRLLAAGLWQRLPASVRQKSLRRRLKKFLAAVGQSPQRRYMQWIGIFDELARAELYEPDFIARLPEEDPFAFLSHAFSRSDRRDPVTAASLADLQTYLPCDLMVKVDIASMANSLECRQPFLDHRLVELAAAMPINLKYRRLSGKRILAQAFSDLLPRSIPRRRKMGFGVPLDSWFRHELKDFARDILLDSATQARGYFRPEEVRRLLDVHQAGTFDHSYRLWSLLFFELWHREWID